MCRCQYLRVVVGATDSDCVMVVFESDVDIGCGVVVSKEDVIADGVGDGDDVLGGGEVVGVEESLEVDTNEVGWVEVVTILLVSIGSEVLVGDEVPTGDCEAGRSQGVETARIVEAAVFKSLSVYISLVKHIIWRFINWLIISSSADLVMLVQSVEPPSQCNTEMDIIFGRQ